MKRSGNLVMLAVEILLDRSASPVQEYRGQPALCAGVQGRQRTAGVKGQRPLAG